MLGKTPFWSLQNGIKSSSIITVDQGLQTTARGPNPADEAISSGCKDVLSIIKK